MADKFELEFPEQDEDKFALEAPEKDKFALEFPAGYKDPGDFTPDPEPELSVGRLAGAAWEGIKDIARSAYTGLGEFIKYGAEKAKEGIEEGTYDDADEWAFWNTWGKTDKERIADAEVGVNVGNAYLAAASAEMFKADPEYFNSSGFLEDCIRQGPQFITQMVATAASLPLGTVFMGLQILGGHIEQQRANGVNDPDVLMGTGLLNVALQLPLEQLGISKLTKFWKVRGSIVKRVKKLVEMEVTEMGTEYVQEYADMFTQVLAENPDPEKLAAYDNWLKDVETAHKQGMKSALVVAPWALIGGGVGNVAKHRQWNNQLTKMGLTKDDIAELKANPTLSPQDFIAARGTEAEREFGPTPKITTEKQFDALAEEQLGTEIDTAQSPEQANAGMSTDTAIRLEETIRTDEERAEAVKTAREEKQKELERQKEAEQASAELIAEAQARAAEELRTESALNAQREFEDNIAFRSGLIRTAGVAIPVMEQSGTPEVKRAVKPIRSAQKVLAAPRDNATQIMEIQNDLRISMSEQTDPRVGSMMQRLDDELESEIVRIDVKRRIEEAEKAKPAPTVKAKPAPVVAKGQPVVATGLPAVPQPKAPIKKAPEYQAKVPEAAAKAEVKKAKVSAAITKTKEALERAKEKKARIAQIKEKVAAEKKKHPYITYSRDQLQAVGLDRISIKDPQSGKIYKGKKGQIHLDLYSTLPLDVQNHTSYDDFGFVDTKGKHYTRAEAVKMVGTGESMGMRETGKLKYSRSELELRAQETRKKMARGALQEQTKEFDEAMAAEPRLQPHTIRHTQRFFVGKQKIYGPKKAGDKGKQVVRRHPIIGRVVYTEYRDKKGNLVLDTPILPVGKKAREEMIDKLIQENKQHADWYVEWGEFLDKLNASRMNKNEIAKRIKIMGILSASRSPRSNQTHYAHVLTQLERGDKVEGGAGTKISAPEASKIMDVWTGKDKDVKTLEDSIKKYGAKVGTFVHVGLYPYDPKGVVVDRHVARLWGFDVTRTQKTDPVAGYHGAFKVAPDMKKMIDKDIIAAAKRNDMSPSQAQAALWFAARPDLAQIGAYPEAAQIKPSKYLSEKEYIATTEDRIKIVHWQPEEKKVIKPSPLLGRVHGYSREIQKRKDARTAMTDYVGFSDWYGAGVRKEPIISGKAHVTEVPYGKIYNLGEDKLNFWAAAAARVKNDPDAYQGNTSYNINAVAYLLREAGYMGFSTGRASGTWFHLFQPARVEPQADVTIALSDVVDSVHDVPQDISALDEILETSMRGLQAELAASLKRNNYPIKIEYADPTIARFGNTTSGKLENGLAVKVTGPLSAIKAFAADAVGLRKAQRMVLIRHSQAEPNGHRVGFTINPKKTIKEIELILKSNKLTDFNLRKTEAGYHVDQFVEGSDIKTGKKIIKAFKQIGTPDTMFDYPIHSEVLGDTKWTGRYDAATQGYMETITDYFGEDKGREITEEGIEEGEKYSGLSDIRQGYAPGVIASEQRIKAGRSAALRGDLRVSESEAQPTQTSLFPVEEKPKYDRTAREYGKKKAAALADAGLPKGERAINEVNRATNYKHALKFEGKWPDFDMYQFTPQAGPAKGATLTVPGKDLNEAAIKRKLNDTIRAFSEKPKFDRSASSLSSASKIGNTTMGSVESDIMNGRDISDKLKGIYLKHGRNTTQDWMSPAKIGARLLRKLSNTGVDYKSAKAAVSPLMTKYEASYKKAIGPKYFRIKEEGYGEKDAKGLRSLFGKEEQEREKEAVRRTIQEFKRRKQEVIPSGVLQTALTAGFKQANLALAGRVSFKVLDRSRDLKDINKALYDQMEVEKSHGDVKAVFHPATKTFYIFTENVKSVLQAKREAWHELGHLSLSELLAKREFSPLLAGIEAKYPEEVSHRIQLFGYKNTAENRAREAEEILVDKFTANEQVSPVQALKDTLKKLAYRFGFKPNEITDMDISKMVSNMRDNLLQNKKPIGNINPTEAKPPIFSRSEPTDTDIFKKWFSGSQIVDKAGKPLTMYHGTDADFEFQNLRPSTGPRKAAFGEGYYFTEDPRYASLYATRRKPTGSLIPAYVSMKKPFVAECKMLTAADDSKQFAFILEHGDRSSALLKQKGYDGIVIKDKTTGIIREMIAFDKNQIKSIFEVQVPRPQAKYIRTDPEKRSTSNIGINSKQNKILDPNDLELSALDLTTQQTIDSLHSIKVMEKKEGKELKTLSGYKSFNLLSNFPTIFSTFLRHGRVKFANDWVKVDAEADGGLLTVWNKLGKTADSFFERLTAKSAQEMLDKGRKNLFGADADGNMLNDQQEIDNIKAATIVEYRQNRELWDWAEKRLKELNKSVLDFAVSSQIVSQESRDEFEREYYVPFYRLVPEDLTGDLETMFPKAGGKKAPGKIHRLEGSAKNIGDPFMNLVNSYAFIMKSGLTNLARVKSLTSAKNLGLLTAVPTVSATKNTIGIRIKGDEKFFSVSDSVVYSSMIEMDSMTNGLFSGTMNTLFKLFIRGPKKLLTFGVTMNPAFRIANFVRDTIHTSFMERTYGNVFASMKGLIDAYRRTPEFIEYASIGGAFSGAYHQRDTLRPTTRDVSKERKKIEREGKSAWNPIKWWDVYERIGEAAENANRLRVFSMKKKRGASAFEAAYDAKDLLDFHRSGQNQLIQFFTQSVPFLNARIQGLYKLGRTAKDPQHAMNFWVAASALTMASLMLHWYNDDDERYKKLTDAERLSYWHIYDVPGIGNLRIPTPFEVGSFFGSLPAAMSEWFQGDRTDKEMANFAKQIAQDVFRMDYPQWMKPLWAQAKNQNLFTKAPIVPHHLLSVEPGMQVKPTTTKTAKLIAGGANRLGLNDFVSSPARVDQFVSDVASFAGYASLQTVDHLLTMFGAFPDDPAVATPRRGESYPSMMLGYGRFIRGDEPPRFTRQQRAFYDYKREYDKILATANLMRKLRMKKERKTYRKEHKPEIRMAKQLTARNRRIQNINAKISLILKNENLNSKQKATMIDEQLNRRHAVFAKAIKKVKEKMEE